MTDSNIAPMDQQRDPAIIISAIYHLPEVIDQADAVISILGQSDKLQFPDVGGRPVMRLAFDDRIVPSKTLIPPNRQHIADLIEFARRWNGVGTLLIHCRAGSSRSPAAAMIAAAALGRPNSTDLVVRVRTAKAYFRPNEIMLRFADDLLGITPGLLDLSRSVPGPTRIDKWAPVGIPLTTINPT
jgi:predicted protein tyrosine phosphatase